jgi:hypothetical protein
MLSILLFFYGLTALHSSDLLPALIESFLAKETDKKVQVFEEMKRLEMYPTRR